MTKRKHNKSAFVRALPTDLTAAEVVDKGKNAGIKLTEKQVYVIRSLARKKEITTTTNGKTPKGKVEQVAKRVRKNGSQPTHIVSPQSDLLEAEQTFLGAVKAIGFVRARIILAGLDHR